MSTKCPLPTSQQNHYPFTHNQIESKQTTHQRPQTLRIITVNDQKIHISPLFLHMQHHSTIQIFLYFRLSIVRIHQKNRLSIVRIFPLVTSPREEGYFSRNLNLLDAFPQKEMRASVSKSLIIGITSKRLLLAGSQQIRSSLSVAILQE